jgi:hypothetical protein
MIELLYYFSFAILIATLFYASYSDMKKRIVKFYTWYPLIIIGMISTATYVYLNFNSLDTGTNIIICASIFAFFILGLLGWLGGADAWALIFISIFTIPFANTFVSPDGIAMATYTNAIIFVLIFYPIWNWITSSGTDAPFYYRILAHRSYGYNEYGFSVTRDFGYIIDNGIFYYDFPDFLYLYMRPSKLFYTKKFMDDPEKYKDTIRHYESDEMKNEEVWMLNAIPFIAFIFAGFLTMIFIGDLFNMLINSGDIFNGILLTIINATDVRHSGVILQ